MNHQILNKLLIPYVKCNPRLLNLKYNINKYSIIHYSVNYKQKNENNSLSLSFSKCVLQKKLKSTKTIPLYINIRTRNLSDGKILVGSVLNQDEAPIVEKIELPKPPDLLTQFEEDPSMAENLMKLPEILFQLSQIKPVLFIQDQIIQLHQDTGLPWWSTIILTGLFIRTLIILPLAINQMRIKAKLQHMDNLMIEYKKKLMSEYKEMKNLYGWPDEVFAEQFASRVKKQEEHLYKTERIHPNKIHYLIMIQTTIWIYTSLALRNLCHRLPPSPEAIKIYQELSDGGFNWIADLTLTDPKCILPIILTLSNLSVIVAHTRFTVDFNSLKTNLIFIGALGLNFSLIPVAICAPAGVNLFWVTSSIFGLGQVYLLHSPFFLRLMRLPPLDSKDPYWFYYKLWKTNSKDIKP